MLQVLFQPTDLRTGLVVAPLRGIERLVQIRPSRPAGFQPSLQSPLLGKQRLQRGFLLAHRLLVNLRVVLQHPPAQGQHFRTQPAFFRAIFAVLLSGLGLALQVL